MKENTWKIITAILILLFLLAAGLYYNKSSLANSLKEQLEEKSRIAQSNEPSFGCRNETVDLNNFSIMTLQKLKNGWKTYYCNSQNINDCRVDVELCN